ncbi:MAG TPA: substrate-binding domain-containing protein [Terriglobales bacterium]|nr:substrate-binding domain-containing protein [Terriglobales bacterium]
MAKCDFVISLTTADNDYQALQAASAEEAARRLGVALQIIHAQNDPIVQSQQLLKIVQSPPEVRPRAILFEPAGGTAHPQVAQAAASAGIACAVLNREADYTASLRRSSRLPFFSITSDHEEVGRIQGRQLAAILPKGGAVLYIEGPSQSLAAKQRTAGMNQTRPSTLEIKTMRGQWTEESGHRAISSWLRLSTSQRSQFDAVAAQDDSMAMGARKAFQELTDAGARDRWLALPFLGCDGGPESGQAWVRRGLLAATVVIPANAGQALELLVRAFQTGALPPERTLTVPTSFPALDAIAADHAAKLRALSASRG